ncbi:MAG: hypothetical protein JWP06_845 [Candidatus Saccharibacteria bacterium]|nr:hypothetical protein [Candidatus Saccharibacteria bacterium]
MNIHRFGDQTEKPFHSSGYAEVSNGGSIGSTNSQTFGQRYNADQSRSVVRKYRDSHIGRGGLRYQARQGVIDSFRRDPIVPTGRQVQNTTDPLAHSDNHPSIPSVPQPRPSFKEPPTRGFNPYA